MVEGQSLQRRTCHPWVFGEHTLRTRTCRRRFRLVTAGGFHQRSRGQGSMAKSFRLWRHSQMLAMQAYPKGASPEQAPHGPTTTGHLEPGMHLRRVLQRSVLPPVVLKGKRANEASAEPTQWQRRVSHLWMRWTTRRHTTSLGSPRCTAEGPSP